MRYLVVADVHSNLEALEAVISDAVEAYDSVLFLGDAIGYGPNPNECVERLSRFADVVMLAGNHDLAAVGAVDIGMFNDTARTALEWTRGMLSADVARLLQSLQPRLDQPDFALAHASPRNPVWEYMLERYQASPNYQAFTQPLCLIGHTHVPTEFAQTTAPQGEVNLRIPRGGDSTGLAPSTRYIINPGSVGQPRDGDPRAAYGILNTDAETFDFRRVSYPVEVTQHKIRVAGLPDQLAYRLAIGR